MGKTIVTHDGKFHADDVFAVATLLILDRTATVVRTRKLELISKGDIVVDVGGSYNDSELRFDHHQKGGAGIRPNSVPYAAFGLVWKKFGETLCGDKIVSRRVEETLVVPIDANDNGVTLFDSRLPGTSPYEISDAIRAFVPTWQEGEETITVKFMEAVSFAIRVIEREIKRSEAVVAGQNIVTDIYHATSDKRLLELPEDYSWKETLVGFPEPLYVVHPQNGTWRLYCVRDNPHQFTNRKDLPESWAGLRDGDLAKVTGVEDAVFVHRNRFMAVTRSKEGALALAQKALVS